MFVHATYCEFTPLIISKIPANFWVSFLTFRNITFIIITNKSNMSILAFFTIFTKTKLELVAYLCLSHFCWAVKLMSCHYELWNWNWNPGDVVGEIPEYCIAVYHQTEHRKVLRHLWRHPPLPPGRFWAIYQSWWMSSKGWARCLSSLNEFNISPLLITLAVL